MDCRCSEEGMNMKYFKPYTTLGVGIVLGIFVVPVVTRKLGVSIPGA